MTNKQKFFTLLLLSLFSLFCFITSGISLYKNFSLNGDYLVSLFSTLVCGVLFFLSFYSFNTLFMNSTKNIEAKNLLGTIHKVETVKHFPFIITTLNVVTTGATDKKIVLKSFLIDFYSKKFKAGQKVYSNNVFEGKILVSNNPIDVNQVLNIKNCFKSADIILSKGNIS